MSDGGPPTVEADLVHEPLRVGAGTAALLRGTIDAGSARRDLGLRVGARTHPVDGLSPASDPPGRTLWWSLVSLPPATPPGPLPLVLIGDGAEHPLGAIEVSPERVPIAGPAASGSPLVGICMATYEPDPVLLSRQLDSIRDQTHRNWICLISDDASSSDAVAAIEDAIAGDARFVVSRSPSRLGFYANFERALAMVPATAQFVALSDQDDSWHPDKLESLAATLADHPGALLAYSDMRVVARSGEVISDTFWYLSRNAYDNLGTLAIVNTVTGGATLFRRELLDLALPFPPAFSDQHYHDHWLALCALAVGDLAYLDRPTYDYTRHDDSITLGASNHWDRPASGPLDRVRRRARLIARRFRLATAPGALPAAYFDRYLMLRQYGLVLRARAGDRIEPRKRRSLELIDRAERSPVAAAWLGARTLRPLIGHTETLGRERVLLGGLIWRALARARVRR